MGIHQGQNCIVNLNSNLQLIYVNYTQPQFFTTTVEQRKIGDRQVYTTSTPTATSTSQVRELPKNQNQPNSNANALLLNQQLHIGANRTNSQAIVHQNIFKLQEENMQQRIIKNESQGCQRADLKRKAQNPQLEQVVRHEKYSKR